MIRLALGSIAPTVFFFLWNTSGDDDWYEKDLPDWERQTHWCLGKDFRVPKGQDVGLRFFSNLTESMLRYMANTDPKTFSPAKIDHFLYGYTGKLGQDALRFVENVTGARDFDYSGFTDLPIISGIKSGFLRVPYRNPRILTEYYETLDEQTKLHNEFKLTKKRPEGYNHSLYTKLQKTQEQMRELTKKERKVLDDTHLDGDERDNRQLAIQKKRVALAERVLR